MTGWLSFWLKTPNSKLSKTIDYNNDPDIFNENFSSTKTFDSKFWARLKQTKKFIQPQTHWVVPNNNLSW